MESLSICSARQIALQEVLLISLTKVPKTYRSRLCTSRDPRRHMRELSMGQVFSLQNPKVKILLTYHVGRHHEACLEVHSMPTIHQHPMATGSIMTQHLPPGCLPNGG